MKKETKPEKIRKEESEKMKAGRLAMRSQLWRQRREKDGRLVELWKDKPVSHKSRWTASRRNCK